MSDRQSAIRTVLETPGALLVYFPGINEPGWDEYPELWITIKEHEPSYRFWKEDAQSFDKAIKEDICYCIHCGTTTLIFEDVCPNCGKPPYPQEEES